jgi:type II secretory pathway pseudopilin PulG
MLSTNEIGDLSSNKPGFVLLEAVVALMIISLFAIALLTTVGAQVRASDRANVLLVARALAEDRLAAVQMLDYDHIKDMPDSLVAGSFPHPFEDYSWTARTTPVNEEQDLFAAEVVVSGYGYAYPVQTMLHRFSAIQTTTGGRGATPPPAPR